MGIVTAVTRGEWTYVYYAGSNVPQQIQAGYSGNIGMGRFPRGRWIGLKSDARGGYVLTRELFVTGDHLEMNFQGILAPYMKPIEDHPLGYIRVELLSRSDTTDTLRVIPGYSLAESDPLVGDGQSTVVTWKGNADLSPLKGTAVYIRFHIVNSELWQVRFAESEE